jgi:hypothetical protein
VPSEALVNGLLGSCPSTLPLGVPASEIWRSYVDCFSSGVGRVGPSACSAACPATTHVKANSTLFIHQPLRAGKKHCRASATHIKATTNCTKSFFCNNYKRCYEGLRHLQLRWSLCTLLNQTLQAPSETLDTLVNRQDTLVTRRHLRHMATRITKTNRHP